MEIASSENVVKLPFLDAVRAASRPAPARFGKLYGNSAGMHHVFAMIAKVAPTEATVLITGESGCGKELVAHSLHDLSARRRGPFIPINCGAIPSNLIEAELFGYEKGAFTGAQRQHAGCFERAAGGTLFLDEITEMAPDMQVRLLRVLETGKFSRIGGDREISANVRVLAATNREPTAAVRDNALREDLMYRLAVFPLHLPPLREREDDCELLAEHFLRDMNAESGTQKRLSRNALDSIRRHSWPGNVRELRNAIQRAYIMADDLVELNLGSLACPEARGQKLEFNVGMPLADMERRAIFATLDFCRGNKRRCAELLGVSLKTLYNRLTAYHAADAQGAAS
ncbi:MAG: sigma-54 dependent transcriptional regulator [Casimicrobiaceae bacterium]